MNFDHMPELHWTYGYPFALGLMVGRGRRAVRALQEVRLAVTRTATAPTAWRVVWWFGFVSLAADMVYEGARSVYGPVLAALGASALVVGLVTGAGEAIALVLRLAFGPIADRTGRYWSLTIVGYGLTAVCVPLIALAPRLGAAGLAFAVHDDPARAPRQGGPSRRRSRRCSPTSRRAVGRGRGFGVHKALDQVGAFAGPLRGGRGRRGRVPLVGHGRARRPRRRRDGPAAHPAPPRARPQRLRRRAPARGPRTAPASEPRLVGRRRRVGLPATSSATPCRAR